MANPNTEESFLLQRSSHSSVGEVQKVLLGICFFSYGWFEYLFRVRLSSSFLLDQPPSLSSLLNPANSPKSLIPNPNPNSGTLTLTLNPNPNPNPNPNSGTMSYMAIQQLKMLILRHVAHFD